MSPPLGRLLGIAVFSSVESAYWTEKKEVVITWRRSSSAILNLNPKIIRKNRRR
jgi:hypothetical protein